MLAQILNWNIQNKKKCWFKETVFHPAIFSYYQATMGGVDQLCVSFTILFHQIILISKSNVCFTRDQLRESRHRHMKSFRWQTGAVFSLFLDWSIINSCIIYQETHTKFENCNAKAHLLQLLMEHLNENTSDSTMAKVPRVNPPADISHVRMDWKLGHFPKYTVERRRCVFHHAEIENYSSNQCNYYCSVCNVWLHPKCFEPFHATPDISMYKIPKFR